MRRAKILAMSLGTVLLLIGGGMIAGFVNAVAGGGSVVTIPILVEIVGASVANGTNRIAILMQQIGAVAGFQRGKAVPWSEVWPLLPPVMVGALGGAYVATTIPSEAMRRVFAFVVVLAAAAVLVQPSRWMGGTERLIRQPWRWLIFLAVGFYGGFVQAGVGFLVLAGLVLGSGFGLVKANAAKAALILLYTPLVLILFASADQVDLAVGLVLGVGNMTGAWIASNLAIKKGAGWIRWVLVPAAIAAALRMLLA
ncbi:MAG: sulfite exporter TauE/SafE family protein [Acidimicrobiia bacterium]|nr:sulfite exporter TauE/SafE family protein [Acidimicrobiia bacterium]